MSSEPAHLPDVNAEIAKVVLPDDEAIARSRRVREDRLAFPPIYVVVGAYRLLSDPNLRVPAWKKCQHGVLRGAAVGLGWAFFTFEIQKKFIEVFLRNSPKVTGLSHDTLFGYQLPFTVTTYAAVVLLANQVTNILKFFLSKNIRIARDRAWDQTVLSRGKGPEFWQPYVEEWANPPQLTKRSWERWVGGYFGRFVIMRGLLLPLNFYPFIGIAIGAYMKAVGTARYLHKQYFAAKKMTDDQVAVFMEERKWHYRAFGFAAALLESIPIVGLVFTVSNRVGAAMWAHDLEKRQHAFASGDLSPEVHRRPTLTQDASDFVGSFPKKTQ
ncbi:hypothetical protein SCHPADRAFT_902038 [Schizopora paradoxa]|uniref:Uncharacterized protein n=1 Tax=Schizopora paradoxa TaxID=27342 RepID=A0A0H2RVC2_9AGAM|nr:hypothetical protein SCHPADRAFT_902038 [Schizopora paradoxa]